MPLEELVAKALAKRRGIPEEEAQAIVEAMKERGELDYFERMLGFIGAAAEAVKDLPPEAQSQVFATLGPAVASGFSPGGRTDVEELATRLAVIREALRGDDGSSRLEEKLSTLEERLREIAEEKTRRELQEYVESMIAPLNEKIEQLLAMQQLQTGQQPPGGGEEKPASVAEEIKRKMEELEELRNTVADLLGIKEALERDGEMTVEKAKKMLQELGYEVKGPVSPREYEERIRQLLREYEEKMRVREKQIRRELEKQLRIQEKREEMLMALGASLLESIFSVLTPHQAGGAMSKLAGAVKNALKAKP